jgi:hypothetical protein
MSDLNANLAYLTTISSAARANIHRGNGDAPPPSMVEAPFATYDEAATKIADLALQMRTATNVSEFLDAQQERRRLTRWLAVVARKPKLLKEAR